jgi:hypothetical protein
MKKGSVVVLALLIMCLLVSSASFIKGLRHEYLSPGTDYLWTFFCAILISTWAVNDKKEQASFELDWGYMFFFFWPIALPFYLVKTRGFQAGVLMYLGFIFIHFVPMVTNLMAFAYFSE